MMLKLMHVVNPTTGDSYPVVAYSMREARVVIGAGLKVDTNNWIVHFNGDNNFNRSRA